MQCGVDWFVLLFYSPHGAGFCRVGATRHSGGEGERGRGREGGREGEAEGRCEGGSVDLFGGSAPFPPGIVFGKRESVSCISLNVAVSQPCMRVGLLRV